MTDPASCLMSDDHSVLFQKLIIVPHTYNALKQVDDHANAQIYDKTNFDAELAQILNNAILW